MQGLKILPNHGGLCFQTVINQVETFCGNLDFHLERLVSQSQSVAEEIRMIDVSLP